MGANVSQQVKAAASESVSVINDQTQNCVSTASQSEVIQICSSAKGCQNSNVTLNDITFNQIVTYNTSCTESVNITSDIQQQISQAFQQAATAIAQQFQLSQANVNQVASVSAKISTNINDTTVQNCITKAAQNESIAVGCNPDPSQPGFCNITINGATFNQSTTAITDCVLQEQNAQTVINEVTQQISQQGEAKVESIFGPLVAIIIIIIVIIGGVFLGGTKALGDWRLWVVVIVLVLIYLAIAFWRHWFPFEQDSS